MVLLGLCKFIWHVSTLKQFTLSCWLHTLLIGDKFSAVWRCMMSQLRGIRLRMFRKELSLHIYLIVIRHNVQKWLLNPCIPLIFTFKKYTWTLLFHGMQVLRTLLSKNGRRKLVNGMFLCQRSVFSKEHPLQCMSR